MKLSPPDLFFRNCSVSICLLIFTFHTSLFCNEGKDLHKSDINITLISPILSEGVRSDKVELEGLVDDLTVEEIKVVVNNQSVQFVSVNKGYFRGSLNLDERENHLVLYGANSDRKYFRYEAMIVNHSRKEKTLEEKIPPKMSLNHLVPGEFKVLSPAQYESLSVEVRDNSNSIIQLGYVLDNNPPVYLEPDLTAPMLLRLPIPKTSSTNLELFTMDGDKNKVIHKYHFRLEKLECGLKIGPSYGIIERTNVELRSHTKGGKVPIERFYRLKSKDGGFVEHRSTNARVEVSLAGKFNTGVQLKGELLVRDAQGVEAICRAKETIHFYPREYPRLFKLSDRTKLESVKQELFFSIEPPIQGGEMTVLLKWNDPFHGVSGQEWKVLGREILKSSELKRFWKIQMKKRVPIGNYMMKLSMVLGNDQLSFTETMPIEITRSQDDTRDLLQEILAGEDTD